MPLMWCRKTRVTTRRMMTINIYLIGMMGSGKSTIGQLLADRLNMPWYDVDVVIEKKGMTIPEIFDKYGEAEFRRIETQVTKDLSEKERAVVSTGGGVVLNEKNITIMKTSGRVVYLETSKEKLIKNLENGRSNRPLIQDGSLEVKIDNLLNRRGKKYEDSADLIIKTDAYSPSEIADQIIKQLNL